MRQRAEPRQPGAIVVRVSVVRRDHRNDRPEVPWTQAPKMKIGEQVSLALNGLAKAALHGNKCEEAIGLLQTLADSEGVDPTDLYLLSRAYKCAGQDRRCRPA